MVAKLVLLAALASAWYMTGLIAFVQVVHYPLFGKVGPEAFRDYHAGHVRLTTATVLVPMSVELLSSAWLVYRRPEGATAGWVWAGLVAVVMTWLATGLLSVPLHDRLARGFDEGAHRALVGTNVVRAAAWVAHAGIMVVIAMKEMK